MKRVPIYFDYNATTPLDPAVRDAMLPFLEGIWGNPSSIHQIGQRARSWLDDCRDRAAVLFGAKPSEIIFTSGGTEANNLAIFGSARLRRDAGRHLITSAVEHHAVLHCFDYLEKYEGFSVTRLPVDTDGRVSVDAVKKNLRPDTVLVSVMAANNEIGTLQPVAEIGALCQAHGVLFHTDAVQWFGKEPFTSVQQFNANLVSLCAHKFHGPKGAGLLYIKSPLHPHPVIFGGGHENERRAGTENLPAISGMVTAMEKFIKTPVFDCSHLLPLVSSLASCVEKIPGCVSLSPRSGALPNTFAFAVEQADAIGLLAALDLQGICASSGAACSAGSLEPSHVVAALGKKALATPAEVETVGAILPEIIHRAQLHQQRVDGR
jgi:cysteine desulfurase